jgi:uncharacterized protein YcnI
MFNRSISARFGGILGAVAVAMASTVIAAAPASAHASVQTYGSEAKAGAYGHAFIRIPHAEPGKSTVRIDIQIPEGVTAVKPQQVAGWTESVEYAADGKTAVKVTWSGGNLPDTSFADFGISLKYPATPGANLYFKTVQTLNDGATVAWIEIPAAGVDSHSLAKPAPSVTLAAAAAGHGTTPPADGHGTTPPAMEHTAPKWNGEISATLVAKNSALIIVDASTTHAGKAVVVKVTKSGKDKTVLSTKLDTRGDLVRTVARSKSGTNGYTLAKGDAVSVFIGGVKVATTTL